MTKVVHCKKEKYDVYIGRPSKWGNPFKIGASYGGKTLTRETCIDAFESWLLYSDQGQLLLKDIDELKGKVLGCWCKPQSCHGDVLANIINSMQEE